MPAIMGSDWQFRAVGGGSFHCPRCDRERDYTATAVRPMLAIFGRPVLPIRGEQTLVACDDCGAVYDAGITAMPPADARHVQSEDERALEAVLLRAVFSDSAIRTVEKHVVADAVRHYAHRGKEPGPMPDSPEAEVHTGPTEAFDRLARLRGVLSDTSKRRILAAAYRVCAADRELHSQEARFVVQLGELLGLHPGQVREAMKEGRN